MSFKFKNRESGFTIVELLIVIVIIGILAALVIVAYTGIQSRARDTQYKTDAQAILKKAESYAADNNGTYPTAAGNFSGSIASLPSGIAVVFKSSAGDPTNTVTTGTGTPAGAEALYVNSTSNLKTYTVQVCSVNQGLKVFYPVTSSGGSLGTQVAGSC